MILYTSKDARSSCARLLLRPSVTDRDVRQWQTPPPTDWCKNPPIRFRFNIIVVFDFLVSQRCFSVLWRVFYTSLRRCSMSSKTLLTEKQACLCYLCNHQNMCFSERKWSLFSMGTHFCRGVLTFKGNCNLLSHNSDFSHICILLFTFFPVSEL